MNRKQREMMLLCHAIATAPKAVLDKFFVAHGYPPKTSGHSTVIVLAALHGATPVRQQIEALRALARQELAAERAELVAEARRDWAAGKDGAFDKITW